METEPLDITFELWVNLFGKKLVERMTVRIYIGVGHCKELAREIQGPPIAKLLHEIHIKSGWEVITK